VKTTGESLQFFIFVSVLYINTCGSYTKSMFLILTPRLYILYNVPLHFKIVTVIQRDTRFKGICHEFSTGFVGFQPTVCGKLKRHFCNLDCTLHISHCTLYIYIVYRTSYAVFCTQYLAHCTLYIVNCTLYFVQCKLSIVHCPLYIVHCTLYIVHCTLYIVHCTLCFCTLDNLHCTLKILSQLSRPA